MTYFYFAFHVDRDGPKSDDPHLCGCWIYESPSPVHEAYDQHFWQNPKLMYCAGTQSSRPRFKLKPDDSIGVAVIDPYGRVRKVGDGTLVFHDPSGNDTPAPIDSGAARRLAAHGGLGLGHNLKSDGGAWSVWVSDPVGLVTNPNGGGIWDFSAIVPIRVGDQGKHKWKFDPKVCVGAGCGGGG